PLASVRTASVPAIQLIAPGMANGLEVTLGGALHKLVPCRLRFLIWSPLGAGQVMDKAVNLRVMPLVLFMLNWMNFWPPNTWFALRPTQLYQLIVAEEMITSAFVTVSCAVAV